MDPVTPRPRRRWWPALAVIAWLLAGACLTFPSPRRSEPSFPHRVHVVDNQLECRFCHGGAKVADRPGMPPPEVCAPCHDRFDGDKPAERRVAAFFDGGRYRVVAASGLTEDVRFSHGQHAGAARIACETCHGDVGEQTDVPLAPLASKARCMQCHQQRGVANDCATCHRDIDASWRPPSHRPGWLRAHGGMVPMGERQSVHRCELCHEDATGCNACHQQMAPRDHDQTFRLRTHGLQASIDRTRCAVCHTQDSCEQCHQNTRPRSHRGGFGFGAQRHCTSCHFPLQDNGCYVCHRSAASHELAAPLPGDHSPAMNCRLCHGNGVALPHPDGGHVCTACHR